MFDLVKLVYTIGYGGRRIEEFIDLIKSYDIERIIDVRKWSSSRRNPVYSSYSLKRFLEENGIDYMWIPELGGYRRFGVDVDDIGIGSCFESEGFRAYATYITVKNSVKVFLNKLVEASCEKTSAILCCEKIPYRCHRKILSDYLVVKNFTVIHIIDYGKVIKHVLSKCAVNDNGELKYI
uniref:DUF488 family protein n=2 Tax=Staphylothermus marinus TaxID=2280 RepID=A0A7C4HB55_STAMA